MFYLRGTGAPPESGRNDEFGWWLEEARSSASSASMLSCIDSDDPEHFALADDCGKARDESGERIELTSIDGDRERTDERFSSTRRDSLSEDEAGSEACSYTPERLVRCHEYRILTPSPRLGLSASSPSHNAGKANGKRQKRLYRLIDSKQVGASQLRALLTPLDAEGRVPAASLSPWRSEVSPKDPLATGNQEDPIELHSADPASDSSSCERLNGTWEELSKATRRSSREDTSGIHSNDWSSDALSDAPVCLCDELATASKSFAESTKVVRGRTNAINEVASILQGLERCPEKAAALLDAGDITSGHDHLTRLALAIETDGNVPIFGEPEILLRQLRGRVERLRDGNRDIHKDIRSLQEDFQCDEKKVEDLSSSTSKLRRNVDELRYLDDLVNLLRGELERISRKTWPFVLGRTSGPNEEMNLVV